MRGTFLAVGVIGLTALTDTERVNAHSVDTGKVVYQQEEKSVVTAYEVASGSAVTTGSAVSTLKEGWNQTGKNTWVYADENGQQVKKPEGWYLIEGQYLYLDSKGNQVTKKSGWYQIDKKYYYLDSKGNVVNKAAGWYYIDKWYYIKNGSSVTKKAGWYKVSGSWYYILSGGKNYSGWKTLSGKKYYFNSKGKLSEGWFKVSKKEYYQTKAKGLFTLSVVKNSSDGKYYYVNENGKKIDNKLTRLLVKVYRKTTNEKMSKDQKLRAMYMYLAQSRTKNKNITYERRYDDNKYIGKSGWTADYAYQILSSGKGNCYRFACAFGYFAKMLGYDSYVRVGQCTSTRGGFTPHCWAEIKKGSTTYVYDPELQFALGRDLYQKTYQTYPITVKKGKLYKIKF